MTVPGFVEDPAAVQADRVGFEGEGGATVDGYLARPAHAEPRAGLIVIHEAFGLNDHVRDVARRFANLGYLALAPDLYSRTGTPDAGDLGQVMSAMFGLPDRQAVADLTAALHFLRGQPGIEKVGCIGFCSGGRQALLFGFSGAGLDAVVDCWGGYIGKATQTALATEERPTPVLDLCEGLAAPLFAAFGAEDQNPSPQDAAELERRTAGRNATVRIYPDAGHAFFADYRPTYRQGPAFRLWEDVSAFLETHLGPGA